MAAGGLSWRALRFGFGVLVTVLAFLAGAALVDPSPYARWVETGPIESLDRPCAGITGATVAAAVPSARRQVETKPDGWEWSCRWRSSDTATRHRTNPTLYVDARRVGREGAAGPARHAAKRYGFVAAEQLSNARFGLHGVAARRRGLGVRVLTGIGDRAQVYVQSAGVETEGYEASVVAVHGNAIVTARYVAYRAKPKPVRDAAVRAAREAVRAL